jgi:hypothetical protein
VRFYGINSALATGVQRAQAIILSFPGVASVADSVAISLSTLCIRLVVGDLDNNGRVTLADVSHITNAGY